MKQRRELNRKAEKGFKDKFDYVPDPYVLEDFFKESKGTFEFFRLMFDDNYFYKGVRDNDYGKYKNLPYVKTQNIYNGLTKEEINTYLTLYTQGALKNNNPKEYTAGQIRTKFLQYNIDHVSKVDMLETFEELKKVA